MDQPFSFGTLLAHHRGRREIHAVADKVGISRNTLAAIEKGALPTCSTLAKLLDLYQYDGEAPALTTAQKVELVDALIAFARHQRVGS